SRRSAASSSRARRIIISAVIVTSSAANSDRPNPDVSAFGSIAAETTRSPGSNSIVGESSPSSSASHGPRTASDIVATISTAVGLRRYAGLPSMNATVSVATPGASKNGENIRASSATNTALTTIVSTSRGASADRGNGSRFASWDSPNADARHPNSTATYSTV